MVYQYISYLTVEHIMDYAQKKNIALNLKDANILYQFIMDHYKSLLEYDGSIYKLKPLISEELFQKVNALYEENMKKYII